MESNRYFDYNDVCKLNQSGEEKSMMVRRCGSIDELCNVIKEIGLVVGSSKTYSSEDLIIRIQKARVDFYTKSITRTYGIRDKVDELIGLEQELREVKERTKQPRNAKNWQLKHYKIAEAIALQSKDSKKDRLCYCK